jgi:hypothetical protein
MVTDAVSALVPPNSALVRELGALRNEPRTASSDAADKEAVPGRDADVRRYVNSILNNIDSMVDLYKPPPSRQDLLEEVKQGLNRELDYAKQNLKRELDFAIADQFFKHWVFRILAGLLVALVGAFLGIDIWFSQKVNAAQQQVAKMQEQVNGAKLAIYEKASELNKTLDTAREDLLKSRDAGTDVLRNDLKNAQKEIDWVKGTVTDQVKKEGGSGSDLIKKEEGAQLDRLRKEATQKVAHINQPWAVWTLASSWVPPSLAILLSAIALILSIRRR